MKALLILCISLLSPVVWADGAPRDTLIRLLAGQNLVVSTDPEVVILGGADVALSQGPWSEEDVQAFSKTYGYRPTVLPLTHIQAVDGDATGDADQSRPAVADFYHADAQAAYYLYANLPATGALKQRVQDRLENLLNNDFQSQLSEGGFATLPAIYQQLWRVRLGVVPPRYHGGYL